jgi:hypothetical protein
MPRVGDFSYLVGGIAHTASPVALRAKLVETGLSVARP